MWGTQIGGLHEDCVDVAFEVVDRDERLVETEGERFGEGDADEEGSGETGAFGDGDGVQVSVGQVGALQGFADDGNDGAEVFSAG